MIKIIPRFIAIALLALLLPLAHGQTLETLYSFSAIDVGMPAARLVQGTDGSFYGTSFGVIFKVSLDGVFTPLVPSRSFIFKSELLENNEGDFYGTMEDAGTDYHGTIFKVSTNGDVTTMVEFNETNGEYPEAGVIRGNDGNFYGTTKTGGIYHEGTIFRMTPTGELTSLVSLHGHPSTGLMLGRDGAFYGTTSDSRHGSIFRMTTNGLIRTITVFNGRNGDNPSRLVQGSNGYLYGTTLYGGLDNSGTVFRITANGSLRRLVSFNQTKGSHPAEGLLQASDRNFYGITIGDGTNSVGTLFKMTRAGVFTTLMTFNGTNGSYPRGALVQGSDGNLYGTTLEGGLNNSGTVFRLLYSPLFAGVYSGVVPTGVTNILPFTVKITSKMKFVGKIYLNGLKYSLIGQFPTNSFSVHTIIQHRRETPFNVDFSLVATNGNFQLVGTVSNNLLNASLLGDRQPLK